MPKLTIRLSGNVARVWLYSIAIRSLLFKLLSDQATRARCQEGLPGGIIHPVGLRFSNDVNPKPAALTGSIFNFLCRSLNNIAKVFSNVAVSGVAMQIAYLLILMDDVVLGASNLDPKDPWSQSARFR